ncbi:MAG: MFS transporter, partial [Bacteroidia bacterium]|nr:MFS transporter [Bacteroidia bacterium]
MNNTRTLVTLVSVFFFWGFLAASNGIFIPFCKTHFNLNQFESQLIDTSFYGAYFIGSLILYTISLVTGRDVLNTIGYKKSIVYGLIISIAGALLMLLSINIGSFAFILAAFFVIALGFSFQQTAANPFAIALGNPSKGAHRLNLAGGINSLGTTIGPLIVSMALFGKIAADNADKTNASIGSIGSLYLILAGAFAVAAIIFSLVKMNKLTIEDSDFEKTEILKTPLLIIMCVLAFVILFIGKIAVSKMSTDHDQFLFLAVICLLLLVFLILLINRYFFLKKNNRFEPRSFPQLHWGMLAIFVYVGVEVSIQSNMGALLKTPDFGNLDSSMISRFISLYWGSLMIGRWAMAISVFNLSKRIKKILTLLVPF